MASTQAASDPATDLTPVYEDAGKQYGIDPDYLRAQTQVESGGNANAVSEANAQGISQFIPSTARSIGLKDPFDPREAIPAQAKLMRENMDRFGDPALATAAYHGGTDPTKWGPKTQAYLNLVADTYQRMKAGKPQQSLSFDDLIPKDQEQQPSLSFDDLIPKQGPMVKSPGGAGKYDSSLPMAKTEAEAPIAPNHPAGVEPERSEPPGYLATAGQAALHGALAGGTSVGQTLTGPFADRQPPEDNSYIAQTLQTPITKGWSDPRWWITQIVHGAAASSPSLAAGAVGSLAGPWGAAGGFALGSMIQELAPAYQEARAVGLDHDAAVTRAIEQTGVAGAFGAVMGYIPGLSAFGRDAEGALKRPISEALGQIAVTMPALGAGQQVATGAIQGKMPTAEELGTGYAANVGLGAGLLGAHAAMHMLPGQSVAPVPPEAPAGVAEPEAPPPPPAAPGTSLENASLAELDPETHEAAAAAHADLAKIAAEEGVHVPKMPTLEKMAGEARERNAKVEPGEDGVPTVEVTPHPPEIDFTDLIPDERRPIQEREAPAETATVAEEPPSQTPVPAEPPRAEPPPVPTVTPEPAPVEPKPPEAAAPEEAPTPAAPEGKPWTIKQGESWWNGLSLDDKERIAANETIARTNWRGIPEAVRKSIEARAKAPPEEPPATPAAEAPAEPAGADGRVADAIAARILSGDPAQLTAKSIQQLGDHFYGGKLSEGAYARDRLYDAQELGVNRYIQSQGFDPRVDAEQAKATAQTLSDLKDRLPTQTVRAGEKDTHQQFSTPPDFAYAASWAANMRPEDRVIEPSAGTGSLAVFAKNAGVSEVVANEISEKRRNMLSHLGVDRLTQEDARQLHNALPDDIKPTVVLMNPPFSAAPGRMGNRMVLGEGASHVKAALDRLEPGGRLVAIVGRGMTMDAPAFKSWWKTIGSQYDVRANVGVGGAIYRKYGTNFGTRLLVIDKVFPSRQPIIGGEVSSAGDLIDKLKDIRDDRPGTPASAGEQPAGQPVGPEVAPAGERVPGPDDAVRGPVGEVGAGGGEGGGARPVEPVPADQGGRGTTGVQPPEAGGGRGEPSPEAHPGEPEPAPGGLGEQPGERAPESEVPPGSGAGGGGDHLRPDGSDERVTPPPEDKVKAGVIVPDPEHGGELTESVYESYKPQRIAIEGAQPHKGALVQSAAMASVMPPEPTYRPTLPRKLITGGDLTDAQLEAIVYAGEAHAQTLPPDPDGVVKRKGFFIGDGTGVGKGREVAGIILDNWNHGRKKALWISEKMGLANDAKRDWTGIGQKDDQIVTQNKVKAADPIGMKQGILFTTYDTLKSGEKIKTTGTEPADEKKLGKTRVQQIVDWVGKDFDGVIAFDEAHNMGNAIATKGTRGIQEAAAKALAGLELQNELPNARVVYVSATGATEVSNLAYADRLGLWGKGTAFADRSDFLNKIAKGGVAAMELVSRDMKALGHYMARNLSYEGVEYDRVLHELSPPQREMYDQIATAWQVVLKNMMQALEDTGQADDGKAKKGSQKAGILSAFWGGHQRFFNQLITSLQMPSVLRGVEHDVAEGRQAVLQLVNTNEAGQGRALEKAKAQGAEDLEELDMSPRDQLMQLVEKAYPIHEFEQYADEEGNIRVRPAKDSEGNPVINKKALGDRDRLLDDLGSMRVPPGPLEILMDHFGPDAVAEVTGRSQRVVTRLDEKGNPRKVVEKRAGAANVDDAAAFQNGKKKILVFSQAGGTGRSYHADLSSPSANARRSHYLVQAGWRADNAVQGFGRTHRTNQGSAPIFHLVTTDLEGQKRFISSIARRLGQLGALTKGERRTGDQGMFGLQDNLESDEAKAALTQFYKDIVAGKVEGVNLENFEEGTGLTLIDPTTGSLRADLPPMTQFLNRLLSLKVDDQNKVFGAFSDRFRDVVQHATEAGTLDAGVETYRADKIAKVKEQTVYTDPQSGAETKHVQLQASTKNYPKAFDDIAAGKTSSTGYKAPLFYLQNKRSGLITAVSRSTLVSTDAYGRTVEHYRQASPLDTQTVTTDQVHDALDRGDVTKITDPAQARQLWDARVAAAPEYKTTDLHLITGAVLPVWDRLGGSPKVYRLQTDDGQRMLGRVVDNKNIAQTLQRLGAEGGQVKASPAEIATRILDHGDTATLANGWTIKRSLVAGEQRLELKGRDLYEHTRQLEAAGVFRERISYDTRYFIPTGGKGIDALKEITGTRPVTSLGEPEGEAKFSMPPKGWGEAEPGEGMELPSREAVQAAADAVSDMLGGKGEVLVHMGGLSIHTPEGERAVDGMTLGRLIQVAYQPRTLWNLDHEVVHALRNMGLFTEQEWKTLEATAKRADWVKKFDVEQRWPDLQGKPAQQLEEAIAEAFAAAPRMAPGSRLHQMAIGIGRFFDRLRNALTGKGFQSAEDVFGKMRSGEVGAREPGSGTPERMSAASEGREARAPLVVQNRPYDVLRDKKGIDRAASEIKAGLAPTSLRGAKPMEYAIRRHTGESAQAYDIDYHELQKVRDATDRLPKQEQIDFTDRRETLQKQPTPELQKVDDALDGVFKKWTAKIQGLGRGYLANAIEGYMGHIWGNYPEWSAGLASNKPESEMQTRAIAGNVRKQPLTGTGNFLKRRYFPTQKEGIEAGLIPVTTNPVDLQLIKIHEMQKFYYGIKLADQMKAGKLATWVREADQRDAERNGMVKLDDRIFQPKIYGVTPIGPVEPGAWYSPEPMARVFNNYMSQGWHGQSSIYDGIRRGNNALNTLQLGFSGFHAAFVSADTAISKVALGIQQIAQGHGIRGAGNILFGTAGAPAAIFSTVRKGAEMRRAWIDPASATPEMQNIVEAFKGAGGRISMPEFFQTSASGTFFKNLSDLKNPASVFRQAAQMFQDAPTMYQKAVMTPLRIAGRVLDTINQPLMGALVPRAKMGVFADLAGDWLRNHPEASPSEVAAQMTKFQDSVDNRLGQLNYDNLFWNKTAKDIAFITTRSVGWNLGTLREIGGAFVDSGSAIKAMASLKAPQLTTRMAYTIALPVVTAEIGAILTYLATGAAPTSKLDYFYPPTGEPDENGQVDRRSIPGYMKDVIAFWMDPLQTVLNKTAPLIEGIQELVKNRDYYGGIIYDPERDPGPAQAYGDFMLNQTTPFSMRAFNRLHGEGAPGIDQALGFWGFQPAPKSITQPERGEKFREREQKRAFRAREKEYGRGMAVHVFNTPTGAAP